MTNEDLKREMKVYEEAVLRRLDEEKKIPLLIDGWMESEKVGEEGKAKMQGTIDTMCLTYRESARKSQAAYTQTKTLRVMLAVIAGEVGAIKELGAS